MKIENISLFKNAYKQKPEQPDYKLTTKIGDKYEEIGAAWLKTSKPNEKNPDGIKYLSCAIDKKYIVEIKKNPQQELTSAGTKVPDFSEADDSAF